MQIVGIEKLVEEEDGVVLVTYRVSSPACPFCEKPGIDAIIKPAQLYAYNTGALAEVVLEDHGPAVRERFISGVCEKCWDSLTVPEEVI